MRKQILSKTKIIYFIISLVLLSGSEITNADGVREAIAYGVQNAGACGGGNLESSFDYARIFRCVAENSAGSSCKAFNLLDPNVTMKITDEEDWDYDISLLKMDLSVNWGDFADQARSDDFPNNNLRGRDHLTRRGADWADVVFLATHGWPIFANIVDRSGTFPDACPTGPASTRFRMGFQNSSNDCHVHTNVMALSGGWADEDLNRDANVFISTACNSANPCVWERGGYRNMARGNWFLMHNGFYGHHSSPDEDYNNFKDYLVKVRHNGMGSMWLAKMNTPHGGGANENCPISIVYCEDEARCDNMFYWGGARDFKDTGQMQMSKLWYIEGCDPDGSGGTTYAPLPD